MKNILITATPPTPNGDLHVGHISGPYMAADVYRRYCRLAGRSAFYTCGGDDNQSYVAVKAGQTGVSPSEVASTFNDKITATMRRAAMEPDCYVRPLSSSHHRPFIEGYFRRLFENGDLIVKDAPALWCADTGRYLYEAHVSGRCPYCAAPCDGNVCEACGRPNVVVDIVEPKSRYSDRPPVVRKLRQIFFPLSRWAKRLEAFYGRVAMSPHLASLCEAMLADGLPDIPVSHVADWGIPVPAPDFGGQTIYAWFEMAAGYLSSAAEMAEASGRPEKWEDYWKNSNAEVVQFFGFDNGYFHAVLFPAAMMAFDKDIRLPAAFVVNEFYRLEGSKFSTSRGHAVWGQEVLDHFPADVLRYYLCSDRPECDQANFKLSELEATVRLQLLGRWQDWLLDLGRRVRSETGGRGPAPGELTPTQEEFAAELVNTAREVTRAYEAPTFSLQQVVVCLNELVRLARRLGHSERHWNSQSRRHAGLALELSAARLLAALCTPIMPAFGARLWEELGFDGGVEEGGWPRGHEGFPAGQQVRGLDASYFADPAPGVERLQSLREGRKAPR